MNADEWCEKGKKHLDNREYKEAMDAFEKAIEQEPKHIEAWSNKGFTFFDLERYEEALESFEEALKILESDRAIKGDPKYKTLYVEALFGKGATLSNLKRYREALKFLKKVLEIKPEHATALSYKGYVLHNLKRYEEALKSFKKALEINPVYVDALYGKGATLSSLKRYREALKSFKKALEILESDRALLERNRRHVTILSYKGYVLHNLKRYEEALKSFKKALEINPVYVDALYGKGATLKSLGRHKEAIEFCEKALFLDQNRYILYNFLGHLFFNLGDIKEASRRIEKIADDSRSLSQNGTNQNEEVAVAFSLRGRIRIEEGKYDEAIEWFKKAININPYDIRLFLWSAYAEYLKVEFESHIEVGKNIEMKESSEKVYETMRQIKYQEGVVTIIRKLERRLHLPGENAERNSREFILYFLGYLYYKSNDIFKAREKLEECIKLPEFHPIFMTTVLRF